MGQEEVNVVTPIIVTIPKSIETIPKFSTEDLSPCLRRTALRRLRTLGIQEG